MTGTYLEHFCLLFLSQEVLKPGETHQLLMMLIYLVET